MFAPLLFVLATPSALADDAKIYSASTTCQTTGGTASRSTTGLANSSTSSTLYAYCAAMRDEGSNDGPDSMFVATDNSSTASVSCTLREFWYSSGAISSASITASTSSSGYSSSPQQVAFTSSVSGDADGTRTMYCTVPAYGVGYSYLHLYKVDENT